MVCLMNSQHSLWRIKKTCRNTISDINSFRSCFALLRNNHFFFSCCTKANLYNLPLPSSVKFSLVKYNMSGGG